jgi:hypothetical protein
MHRDVSYAGPIDFGKIINDLKSENTLLRSRNIALENSLKINLASSGIMQQRLLELQKENEDWKKTAQYWKDKFDYSNNGSYVIFTHQNAYHALENENFVVPKRYVYCSLIAALGIVSLVKGSPTVPRKDIFLGFTAATLLAWYS